MTPQERTEYILAIERRMRQDQERADRYTAELNEIGRQISDTAYWAGLFIGQQALMLLALAFNENLWKKDAALSRDAEKG